MTKLNTQKFHIPSQHTHTHQTFFYNLIYNLLNRNSVGFNHNNDNNESTKPKLKVALFGWMFSKSNAGTYISIDFSSHFFSLSKKVIQTRTLNGVDGPSEILKK